MQANFETGIATVREAVEDVTLHLAQRVKHGGKECKPMIVSGEDGDVFVECQDVEPIMRVVGLLAATGSLKRVMYYVGRSGPSEVFRSASDTRG